MPTQQQHDWVKNALNVKLSLAPARPALADTGDSAGGEENGGATDGMSLAPAADTGMSMAETAAPAEGKGAGEQGATPVTVTVPIKEQVLGVKSPEIKLAGGRLKATFTIGFDVEGQVRLNSPKGGEESGEKTTASPFGIDGKSYAASIAKTWMDENGIKAFGFDTHLTEIQPKLVFQAGEKDIEIACEAEGTLACGVAVAIKLTLVGHESGGTGETKICTITVGGDYTEASVPDLAINDSIKVSGIKLKLHIAGELAPEWSEIAEDVAKKVAQRLAGAAAFDVAVVAALVVAGLGVIPASIAQLVAADDVDSAGQVVNQTTAALTQGFQLGATGGQAPGDDLSKLGYQAGQQVLNQALAVVKQKLPDESDEVITQWIREWAEKELIDKAHAQISDMVSEAVWKHYATTYPNRIDRMNAFSNIYPEKKGKWTDPLFAKYDRR